MLGGPQGGLTTLFQAYVGRKLFSLTCLANRINLVMKKIASHPELKFLHDFEELLLEIATLRDFGFAGVIRKIRSFHHFPTLLFLKCFQNSSLTRLVPSRTDMT